MDYSDISKQSRAFKWSRRGAVVPSENKQQVALRPDKDVLNFLKSTGKRYQSRINAALRESVKAHGKAAWRGQLTVSATAPPETGLCRRDQRRTGSARHGPGRDDASGG